LPVEILELISLLLREFGRVACFAVHQDTILDLFQGEDPSQAVFGAVKRGAQQCLVRLPSRRATSLTRRMRRRTRRKEKEKEKEKEGDGEGRAT